MKELNIIDNFSLGNYPDVIEDTVNSSIPDVLQIFHGIRVMIYIHLRVSILHK